MMDTIARDTTHEVSTVSDPLPTTENVRRLKVERLIDNGTHAAKQLVTIYRLACDLVDVCKTESIAEQGERYQYACSIKDEIEGIAIASMQDEGGPQ